MKILKTIAAGCLALVLSGCATAEFGGTASAPGFTRLQGDSIYVYSFLDIREEQFGSQFIEKVNQNLKKQLSTRGIRSEVLTFKNSPLGEQYSFGNSSGVIPVEDIIRRNREFETSAGASYRLVIFPSNLNLYDTAQGYQIRWTLSDSRTGQVVWRTTLFGSRTVWFSMDEDSDARAQTLVDGVVKEMDASGLFGGYGALTRPVID